LFHLKCICLFSLIRTFSFFRRPSRHSRPPGIHLIRQKPNERVGGGLAAYTHGHQGRGVAAAGQIIVENLGAHAHGFGQPPLFAKLNFHGYSAIKLRQEYSLPTIESFSIYHHLRIKFKLKIRKFGYLKIRF
jgi:hypothetical protein